MQTETSLNDKVRSGLRAQFNSERMKAILEQAQSMFQESNFRAGRTVNQAEDYELFDSGFIDQALEYVGFGQWAIGRPKITRSNHTAGANRKFNVRPVATAQRSSSLPRIEPISQSIVTLFEAHLPDPTGGFRVPYTQGSNAIEYLNVLIVGVQGSGKTTLARTLAYALTERYGSSVFNGVQVGGIDALLEYGTRVNSQVRFLVGEDLTVAKIPESSLAGFFNVRNIIMQRTGLNQGFVVTGFNSHTLFGIERNLRTTFQVLILKSAPTNPYDRGILKRYFAPELLDWFEQHGAIEDALLWDRWHPHGVLAKVPLPVANTLAELVPTYRSSESDWLLIVWRIAFPLTFLAALTVPFWLFHF